MGADGRLEARAAHHIRAVGTARTTRRPGRIGRRRLWTPRLTAVRPEHSFALFATCPPERSGGYAMSTLQGWRRSHIAPVLLVAVCAWPTVTVVGARPAARPSVSARPRRSLGR